MSYYIKDTTINKVITFDDINETVNYLENLCIKKNRKSRKDFMYDMSELGHGYDDPQGINFNNLLCVHFVFGGL